MYFWNASGWYPVVMTAAIVHAITYSERNLQIAITFTQRCLFYFFCCLLFYSVRTCALRTSSHGEAEWFPRSHASDYKTELNNNTGRSLACACSLGRPQTWLTGFRQFFFCYVFCTFTEDYRYFALAKCFNIPVRGEQYDSFDYIAHIICNNLLTFLHLVTSMHDLCISCSNRRPK